MKTVVVFLILILTLVSGCSTSGIRGREGEMAWRDRMSQFSDSFTELFPLLIDPAKFNAAENQSRIEKSLSELALMAHEMNLEDAQKYLDARRSDPATQVL